MHAKYACSVAPVKVLFPAGRLDARSSGRLTICSMGSGLVGPYMVMGLCWCGSGHPYAACHRPFDRPGPGADMMLAVHPFPWAVRPAPAAPQRRAPAGVPAPDYATSADPRSRTVGDVRTPAEIESLRYACEQAAAVLRHIKALVQPGITTDELDTAAYDECLRRRIYPSTLNYRGFRKSICTSVNEVICHGIPDSRQLRSGDIVNLDVTVFAHGAHGDC